MQRIILSAAMGLMTLAFIPAAHAHHGGPGHAYGGSFARPSYSQGMGSRTSFSGPIRSSSRSWCSRSCWCSRYGCYGYYNPSCCCWYYWCPAQSCYYPFSYFNQYPPTAVGGPAGMASAGPNGPPPVPQVP